MTVEEFEGIVVGLEIEDLDGEVNISGPWNPRYFLDLKMDVKGRKVGAHIEFVLEEDEREDDEIGEWDECQNVVQSLECLEVYDLEGLEEDAEVSDGEGIPKEGKIFESILDEIANRLGCDV